MNILSSIITVCLLLPLPAPECGQREMCSPITIGGKEMQLVCETQEVEEEEKKQRLIY